MPRGRGPAAPAAPVPAPRKTLTFLGGCMAGVMLSLALSSLLGLSPTRGGRGKNAAGAPHRGGLFLHPHAFEDALRLPEGHPGRDMRGVERATDMDAVEAAAAGVALEAAYPHDADVPPPVGVVGLERGTFLRGGGGTGGVTGGTGGVSMPTRRYDDLDVVIMYANGTEPVHAAARVKAGGSAAVGARDRDNEELRYAVRAIEAHMPWWGGNLIIYTDTPPLWLNRSHPRVRVVLHTEVYPKEEQAEVLPTFNSDSILSTMANIPGLAKYFVKFDDDNIVGSVTTRDDFVDSEGRARIFYERHYFQGDMSGSDDEAKIKKLSSGRQTWLAKMYNTRKVFTRHRVEFDQLASYVDESVPRDLFRFSKHAPVVMKTDMVQRMYVEFADEFKQCRTHVFRSYECLDVHALWHWTCRLEPGDNCVMWEQKKTDREAHLIILSLKNEKTTLDNYRQLGDVLRTRPKFFTINDGLGGARDQNSHIANFAYRTVLPMMFPFRSSYELAERK